MPLTETVWPQFAMQVFGVAISTPVRGMGEVIGGPNWYRRAAIGQPYLLLQTVFR